MSNLYVSKSSGLRLLVHCLGGKSFCIPAIFSEEVRREWDSRSELARAQAGQIRLCWEVFHSPSSSDSVRTWSPTHCSPSAPSTAAKLKSGFAREQKWKEGTSQWALCMCSLPLNPFTNPIVFPCLTLQLTEETFSRIPLIIWIHHHLPFYFLFIYFFWSRSGYPCIDVTTDAGGLRGRHHQWLNWEKDGSLKAKESGNEVEEGKEEVDVWKWGILVERMLGVWMQMVRADTKLSQARSSLPFAPIGTHQSGWPLLPVTSLEKWTAFIQDKMILKSKEIVWIQALSGKESNPEERVIFGRN